MKSDNQQMADQHMDFSFLYTDFVKWNRNLLRLLALEVTWGISIAALGAANQTVNSIWIARLQLFMLLVFALASLLNLVGVVGTALHILVGEHQGHKVDDWLGHIVNSVYMAGWVLVLLVIILMPPID